MTLPLASRLQHHAAQFPDKPVFIHPGPKNTWETVTYRQLAERANLFARGLSGYGIPPGTRAALMVPPSVDFFALVFAILQTGLVPVMVDPAVGLANVTPCLAECAPQVYFGSPLTQALRWLYGWGKDSLKWNLSLADIARCTNQPGKSPFNETGSRPDNPRLERGDRPSSQAAAIVYTSGSTGLPKGAIYTAENFSAQIEILAKALHLRGDEIDLPAFPLFAIIDCLLGVTAVIPEMRFPPPAKVNPAKMSAAIQKFQVETMFVSPAALARVACYGADNQIKFKSLKKVITAGAPAPAEIQEQFVKLLPPDGELFGIYGSTEALPVALVNSCEILGETRHLAAQGAGVCIGRPVAGMQVQILPISDEALSAAKPLPDREIGEIAVRGTAVTGKYVGREAHNRLAKIVTENGEIIHRMGDLGYFDARGRLWYCGRKSQRVVTPAGTLFTEPVEGLFNAHPAVYRSALVSVEKAGIAEAWLWVELSPAARGVDQNRLKGELLALAQSYEMGHAIKNILFHPKFPTDVRHNSKIIREKLAREASRR
ncbi:MAG: fatty acid CoA ligase family protein [Anaerolineales bacterium]|jgi:acyl-CoA synthetase (AMP-forming)/AMP-acid ligase II|nr:fatty acid CoA ligase family protein [Anaerolineales bacterium]